MKTGIHRLPLITMTLSFSVPNNRSVSRARCLSSILIVPKPPYLFCSIQDFFEYPCVEIFISLFGLIMKYKCIKAWLDFLRHGLTHRRHWSNIGDIGHKKEVVWRNIGLRKMANFPLSQDRGAAKVLWQWNIGQFLRTYILLHDRFLVSNILYC